VNAGSAVTFSVTASGTSLDYQWMRNAQPIAGATAASYTLSSVTSADDQASYSVKIANPWGSVTSSNALLTVMVAPTITVQPKASQVSPGATVELLVSAAAPHGALTYQWYQGPTALKNGGVISGATSSALTLTNVSPSDSGSYSVTVSDAAGTVTSNAVPVIVAGYTRLVVTASGVALSQVGGSQVGGRSVLTRTLRVLSGDARTDLPWTAKSDSPWLSVTPSGLTGGNLVLTADPGTLPQDATQFASVTVSSTDTAVTNQPTVRVGLYVSATVATSTTLPSTPVSNLATSPVEPLVAISGAGTDVSLYNVYTGALVTTFAGVASQAGYLVFAEDGRSLFVVDDSTYTVIQLDIAGGKVINQFDADTRLRPQWGNAIAVLHPNGYPMLATGVGYYYDLASGKKFTDLNPISQSFSSSAFSLTTSPDQSLLVAQNGSGVRLTRSTDGTTLSYVYNVVSVPIGLVQNPSNGQSCINDSGTRLYTASGAPYQFSGIDMTTGQLAQTLTATNYPDAIQCSWNGLIVGGVDNYSAAADVYVYDGRSGANLAVLFSSGAYAGSHDLLSRGLAVSGDGTMLVSLWSAPSGSPVTGGFAIQPLPAPP
jgi:hypothetical protein